LKAILTTPGVTIPTVHILGGTAAVPSTVEAQLTSAAVGLKPSKINRIAGADRYATAGLIAAIVDSIAGYDGEVALLNGTSLVDALVAGPLLAAKDWIPGLTPSSALNSTTKAQILKATNVATNDVVAIGGATAIPTTLLGEASAASTAAADLAPVIAVTENATSFTATFTASLAINGEFDCATAGGTAFDASFRIDGSLNTSFAGNAVTAANSASAAGVANAVCTVTVARTAAFAAGTKIEFLGLAEGTAGASSLRSLLPGSTTVVDDNVKPTMTIAGIRDFALSAGVSDGYSAIYFAPSETLGANVLAAGEVSVYRAADAADGTLSTDVCLNDQITGAAPLPAQPTGVLTYTCSVANTTTYAGGDDVPLVLAAGDVVVVAASAVTDAAGNNSDAQQFVVALDTTKPVITATGVVATGTPGVIKIETGATDISLTGGLAGATTGSLKGHVANAWRIVLRNSTATVPTASVDEATRRVTLTFDFVKHDGNDILWAVAQNPAVAAIGIWAGGSAGFVTGYLDGDLVGTTTANGTLGTSVLNVTLTSDSTLFSTANVTAGTGATCVPTTTNIAAPGGAKTFTVACAAIASGAAAPAGPLVLGSTLDLSVNDATGTVLAIS